MELTKFGHACVRLAKEDQRLVIDPGVFTDPAALDDAAAVLVTHEHADHFMESSLRAAAESNPALEIWTNTSVAAQLTGLGNRVHAVGEGDQFTAAGFNVTVHGTWHAIVHPDIPRITNIGFLIDNTVFHPGDALTAPQQPIENLLLPVHAPWSKMAEIIDWIREVKPTRTYAIHDSLLNENGLGLVAGLLGERGPGTGVPYARLAPGESITLG
jgi:L-ascorbate metabolism protein UlaG (beta-lactamase superfamily)